MLTVVNIRPGSSGDTVSTVLRVGRQTDCEATRDAVIEVLGRAGVAIGQTEAGGPIILSVTVDDTPDTTITEGDEVSPNTSVVGKAEVQLASGE